MAGRTIRGRALTRSNGVMKTLALIAAIAVTVVIAGCAHEHVQSTSSYGSTSATVTAK